MALTNFMQGVSAAITPLACWLRVCGLAALLLVSIQINPVESEEDNRLVGEQVAGGGRGGGGGGGRGKGDGTGHGLNNDAHASDDGAYFGAYSQIHHQIMMLQDSRRMEAYHAAIMQNKEDFQGKVVLDVGCGTGVLSIWAAQAGARRVHAVEASDAYIFAQQLAQFHNLTHVITVHHNRIEDLSLEDLELEAGHGESQDSAGGVDVVLSEWMGKFLIKEGMLASVLDARDRFAGKPNSRRTEEQQVPNNVRMFPSSANLTVALLGRGVKWMHAHQTAELKRSIEEFESFCADSSRRFAGLDLCGGLGPEFRRSETRRLFHQYFRQDLTGVEIVGNPSLLTHLDLETMSVGSTTDAFHTQLVFSRTNSSVDDVVCGVAGWFAVGFPQSPRNGVTEPIVLSTEPGPLTFATHWGQSVFLFPDGCVDFSHFRPRKADLGKKSALCDEVRVDFSTRPKDLNLRRNVMVSINVSLVCGSEIQDERNLVTTQFGQGREECYGTGGSSNEQPPHGLDAAAIKRIRERRRRAVARLQEAQDIAKFVAFYDSAWDNTVGQHLQELQTESSDVGEDGRSLSTPASESQPPPSQTSGVHPGRGSFERWHPKSSSGQLNHCASPSHGPQKALGQKQHRSVAWSRSYEFEMGDVEHSLRPASFAGGIDLNGDGTLQWSELAEALDVFDQPEIFYAMDANHDGRINYAEFDLFEKRSRD